MEVQVVLFGGRHVLVDQLLDHLTRRVQFVQTVLEQRLFLELIQERFTLSQLIVLNQNVVEELRVESE